jgi:hypothetical protein
MSFSSGENDCCDGNMEKRMNLPPKWIVPKSFEEIDQEKSPNGFQGTSGIIFPDRCRLIGKALSLG